jgi:hypothetical protein
MIVTSREPQYSEHAARIKEGEEISWKTMENGHLEDREGNAYILESRENDHMASHWNGK